MTDQPSVLVSALARDPQHENGVPVGRVFDVARGIQFTGVVTFHFLSGRPTIVETGRPFRVPVVDKATLNADTEHERA